MDPETTRARTTRRALLSGAIGTAAAMAVAAARPAVTGAAEGDNVVLGDTNDATNTTLVVASGVDQTGLMAKSTATSGIGVEGWAQGTDAAGGRFVATATSGTTFGAVARTHSAAGVGVYARNMAGGVGLSVDGKATFRRSGKATISAGKSSKVVTLAGVSSASMVLAVLATNRSSRWVRAAVPASGQFTIYLNGTVSSDTKCSWMVIDPFVLR